MNNLEDLVVETVRELLKNMSKDKVETGIIDVRLITTSDDGHDGTISITYNAELLQKEDGTWVIEEFTSKQELDPVTD